MHRVRKVEKSESSHVIAKKAYFFVRFKGLVEVKKEYGKRREIPF